MKLIVFAHRLEVGGTQVNAIELAAALRDDHGFDVVVFATPGPMVDVLRDRGLRFVAAPDSRFHPSLRRMRALRAVVREEKPDLIHAWDWWQGLEAYYAVRIPERRPILVTDMMMELTRVMPKSIPTTFGTPRLVGQAVRAGWQRAELLLPPVDVERNAPAAADAESFRSRFGLRDNDIAVVSVSRLAEHMKLESLVRSIAVVRRLGNELPIRLLIVGDGAARIALERLADEVNGHLRRDAVVLTGALLDPRPAYAAADIVIGMGGSALRGMAFCKPVVVLGANGFAVVFSPETAPAIHHAGMYGRGDGDPNNDALAGELRRLARDRQYRSFLGQFGRDHVVRNHALDVVSLSLARLCRTTLEERSSFGETVADVARMGWIYCRERKFLTPSRDAAPTKQGLR